MERVCEEHSTALTRHMSWLIYRGRISAVDINMYLCTTQHKSGVDAPTPDNMRARRVVAGIVAVMASQYIKRPGRPGC